MQRFFPASFGEDWIVNNTCFLTAGGIFQNSNRHAYEEETEDASGVFFSDVFTFAVGSGGKFQKIKWLSLGKTDDGFFPLLSLYLWTELPTYPYLWVFSQFSLLCFYPKKSLYGSKTSNFVASECTKGRVDSFFWKVKCLFSVTAVLRMTWLIFIGFQKNIFCCFQCILQKMTCFASTRSFTLRYCAKITFYFFEYSSGFF